MSEAVGGSVQPPHECRNRPRLHSTGPALVWLVVGRIDKFLDGLSQALEVPDHHLTPGRGDNVTRLVALNRIAKNQCPGLAGDVNCIALELRLDPFLDERDLVAGVGGVGE